jgi:squalene-hopene/tetraprenyl-beta-curcumene cyclase
LTRAGAGGTDASTSTLELPPHARYDADTALNRSIPLLQHSSLKYFEESHCVGCHHQMATTVALGAARTARVHVDEVAAAELVKQMQNEFRVQREMNLEGGDREVLTRRLFELSRTGISADASTDAAVAGVMATQAADGSWRRSVPISRAPMQEGIIALTAEAVRAISVYAPSAMEAETAKQLAHARSWLLHAQPRTTIDASMRLTGLWSSHASASDLRDAARILLSMQRRDGGWGGNPDLPSDAFSTGEALWALRETGSATVRDRAYRRAIDFLLRTQDESGAWHVRSRAVKVMPYYDSDFPFGDDQWISAAGTAMADVAIASTLQDQPTDR